MKTKQNFVVKTEEKIIKQSSDEKATDYVLEQEVQGYIERLITECLQDLNNQIETGVRKISTNPL